MDYYPHDFPANARARIEAERIRAQQELQERQQSVPWSRHGPDSSNDRNFYDYILRVFSAFGNEACGLGSQGIWAVDRVEKEAFEFLRLFTIAAFSADGTDKNGRRIRNPISQVDGSLLPDVEREFCHSKRWRDFQAQLLGVANRPGKPNNPTWTTEQVWGRIDRQLLDAKLADIAEEMQPKLAQKHADARSEGRKKGNSGFYNAAWPKLEADVANEWAERIYRTILQVWATQGQEPCRPFYQAVYNNLLAPLFACRKAAGTGEIRLKETATRSHGKSAAAMDEFVRAMNRLDARWKRRVDIASRESEYAQQEVSRPKAHVTTTQPRTPIAANANNKLVGSRTGRKPSPKVASRRAIVGANCTFTTRQICKRLDLEEISPDWDPFPGWVKGLNDTRFKKRIYRMISKDKRIAKGTG